MKNLTYYVWLMAVVISLTSCSKDNVEELDSADLTTTVTPVSYSDLELEVLDLVNAYRSQQGLSELQAVNEGSVQAASHNDHMISSNEVCHDYFGSRYQALVQQVKAEAVSENVGYGYRTADAVVNAWINSEGHRENILGDFTHFGISVKEGKDGKFYFTNIFVRK